MNISKNYHQQNNLKNQKGQSLVEYLIIVALVAVGGIGIMKVVGQSINVSFAKVAKALGANVEGQITTAEVKQNHFSKRNFKNFLSGASNANSSGEQENE